MGAEGQMTADKTAGSVLRTRLRRIASAHAGTTDSATPVPVPPPPPLSPERAAATAAARAANRASALAVTPEAVAAKGITLAELPELLPERALIAVIEAPGERLGVVALCPSLVASLIEMQTMGRITARAAESRRATRADAAIAADFVNLLMEEYAGVLAALPGQTALAGFRYASHLDDPRPLALMLEDGGFLALVTSLRIGRSGERRGTLLVAVPALAEGAAPVAAPAAATCTTARPTTAVAEPPGRGLLSQAVQEAPVEVVAVLCRRPISLRELRMLKPGQVLPLPRGAIEDCTLETRRGQRLARGKLGEQGGCHALRLHEARGAGARNGAGPIAIPPAQPADEVQQMQSGFTASQDAGTPALAPVDLTMEDEFRGPDALDLPTQLAQASGATG